MNKYAAIIDALEDPSEELVVELTLKGEELEEFRESIGEFETYIKKGKDATFLQCVRGLTLINKICLKSQGELMHLIREKWGDLFTTRERLEITREFLSRGPEPVGDDLKKAADALLALLGLEKTTEPSSRKSVCSHSVVSLRKCLKQAKAAARRTKEAIDAKFGIERSYRWGNMASLRW